MSNNAPYKGSPSVKGSGSGPYKQSPPPKPPVKPAPSGSGPYKGGSGPYRK
jgi:hypothetical protein